MAIFVDQLRPCPRTHKWPYKQSCRLTADTPEELDRFAVALGLQSSWSRGRRPAIGFRGRTKKRMYFKITATKRRLALKLGAQDKGAG